MTDFSLRIPLKQFNDYTKESAPWICYKNLVSHGTDIIAEKIRLMQEHLALLESMQREIERSEISYQSNTPATYSFPERVCRITPFDGLLGCDESNKLMKKLIMEIFRQKMKLGNGNGLLLLKNGGEWKEYLFVDVDATAGQAMDDPSLLLIPTGQYLYKKMEENSIRHV